MRKDLPVTYDASRVGDYIRFRPNYPPELIDFLHGPGGIAHDAVVADVGAGSGIATKALLEAGHRVIAVEPNVAMLEAVDDWLRPCYGYSSVRGAAEATTLAERSVDVVVAAHAFHCFDPVAARAEFARILKPHGRVALFWNSRSIDGSPFSCAYEAFLRQHSTDYREKAAHLTEAEITGWFGGAPVATAHFRHVQRLNRTGLEGRLLSSIYTPRLGHSEHRAMIAALGTLFGDHAEQGHVQFHYDTRVYVGGIAGGLVAKDAPSLPH